MDEGSLLKSACDAYLQSIELAEDEAIKDEAIKEAVTILVKILNILGTEYNLHLLASIVKGVAPDLG